MPPADYERDSLRSEGVTHPLVEARGGALDNRVLRVTLTGLWEGLHDVILVGNSYGGMVITGTADAAPDPLQRFADRAKARGWPVHRLLADHTPERSAREPLVALLLGLP